MKQIHISASGPMDYRTINALAINYAGYRDCGPGPYRNFSGRSGREYLCNAHGMDGDTATRPTARILLDEYIVKLT